MLIVIDGRMLGWTGIGRYTHALLRELQHIDHDNDYLVLLRSEDYESWNPTSPRFRARRVDIAPYSASEQFRLGRILDEINPDLVHFTHFCQPVRYSGRFVVTVHDLTLLDFSTARGRGLTSAKYAIRRRAMRSVLKHGVRSAVTVMTPSRFTASRVKERFGIDESRLVVISEAASRVHEGSPVPYEGLAGGQPFVLYVGNAYPYKNLKTLVEAFESLRLRDHHLVLVGPPNRFYDDLQRFVRELRVPNIVITGFVPGEQLGWLYDNARAFAFPSRSEGFGLPGLEAMAHGLPVVAANATSLPEVYRDAAVYFDPTDTKDLAGCLGAVLGDADLRARLIRSGHEHVRRFSWRITATRTLDVYRRALIRTPSRPAESSAAAFG
jgi:glycosyltransferase involved in cell wall biosynthesis